MDANDQTLSRDNPIPELMRSGERQREESKFGDGRPRVSDASSACNISKIVLKFTTIAENCAEMPSFVLGMAGGRIGREPSNEVSVPSDTRLAAEGHARIEYMNGSFYLADGGFDSSASIRISMGDNRNADDWIMETGAIFSAGNSLFKSLGVDEEGNLIVAIVDGPAKGTTKKVGKEGATIGRSSDNGISVPDRELSRKHSKIEFSEHIGRYIVMDIGSTNGTYMQLVGPYGGLHKLFLNDHILVGRTGFSINRFDYGLSEETGHRQTMEDASTIIQHLNIPSLNSSHVSPQSFFGIFDGHGGAEASAYLSQNLHTNIVRALDAASEELLEASRGGLSDDGEDGIQAMDAIVMRLLKDCFVRTDAKYLSEAPNPQHGSTATTTLLLGQRLYCANVGDSRSMLCR